MANSFQSTEAALTISAKRPEFEGKLLKAAENIMAALNAVPNLKKRKILFSISFVPQPLNQSDEGSNWGTSRYERWGLMGIILTQENKPPVEIAVYRMALIDGSETLLCHKLLRNMGFDDASFSDLEKFKKFFEQIFDSAIIAMKSHFGLAENATASNSLLVKQMNQVRDDLIEQLKINQALDQLLYSLNGLVA